MNKKRYMSGSESDKTVLRSYIRTTKDHKAGQRAQAILWSIEGRERTDLAKLFHVRADTISLWLNRWDPNDLSKLSDEQRSGRPPLIAPSEKKTF